MLFMSAAVSALCPIPANRPKLIALLAGSALVLTTSLFLFPRPTALLSLLGIVGVSVGLLHTAVFSFLANIATKIVLLHTPSARTAVAQRVMALQHLCSLSHALCAGTVLAVLYRNQDLLLDCEHSEECGTTQRELLANVESGFLKDSVEYVSVMSIVLCALGCLVLLGLNTTLKPLERQDPRDRNWLRKHCSELKDALFDLPVVLGLPLTTFLGLNTAFFYTDYLKVS